jgi:hypothetical protein
MFPSFVLGRIYRNASDVQPNFARSRENSDHL